MEIKYLWVDEIVTVGVGVTTDMQKITYNIGQMDEETQRKIGINLLPLNNDPVLGGMVILGRFLCIAELNKDGANGKMRFFDIRLRSELAWVESLEKTGNHVAIDEFKRDYKSALLDISLELDSFELSIRRLD